MLLGCSLILQDLHPDVLRDLGKVRVVKGRGPHCLDPNLDRGSNVLSVVVEKLDLFKGDLQRRMADSE